MKDNYSPVLKMLGQRTTPDSGEIFWIALLLLLLPILLLLGNYLRLYLIKRHNLAYGFDQLEKMSSQKGLSYPEQKIVEQMATLAHLSNPVILLGSIEIFDRTVALWVSQLMHKPWQDMDEQIAILKSIRKKIEFRYLSAERPPISTRELKIGQKIYSLAASKKGLKLIYADILDLDDLAITITPFQTQRQHIQLTKNHNIWGFFWSEGGGEFRFRTHLIKEFTTPVHYLMIAHGDELHHDSTKDMLSCQQDLALVVEWISSVQHGTNLSPNIYDRIETPPTLAVTLSQLSSSGITLSDEDKIEVDDLLRIQDSSGIPSFLADRILCVIKKDSDGIECKFIKLEDDDRHELIAYLAENMSIESFTQRLKRRAQYTRNR